MISVFDTGFLHVLFDPNARVPADRETGKPAVDRGRERIDHLVEVMSHRRDKIVIPAPALAEFLLLASEKRNEYLTLLRRKSVFEIAGFNDPEAVELVEYCLRISPSKKLKARSPETWAKLNFDRQIIAIALTHRADVIYSLDKSVRYIAGSVGLKCLGLEDLPLPPPMQLPLEERNPDPPERASDSASLSEQDPVSPLPEEPGEVVDPT